MRNKINTVIKLLSVSKDYLIHHEKPTLVERVMHGRNEKFRALDNINLEIRKKDTVGVIGPNGSGKTTLLKIITGITSPTRGTVFSHGRIISLIDLEAGFHPDLNGEQNIFLNGMLLGISKKTISKKLDDIIKFADIGKFIDTPLYTYSQGMKLRLGFSVIVLSRPDALIFDESLAVGDASFQKKAINKIKDFQEQGTSIIMVSHDMKFIKRNCKRIIIMNNGKIIHEGNTQRTINKYNNK
jgi:ABC-2 type transport system ATP-binding protein